MRQLRTIETIREKSVHWLASSWFWRLTVALFVLQASYVALVGRFSMAFDEYYHLGTIQAYAKVWLPWSVQQPSGPAAVGAIPADGSYLYHYLMSFPYRILTSITSSEITQIIVLRLIDVAIVLAGLYVFRRLLLWLGMPRSAAHGLLWIITFIPVTPFLAGQLTYDALWFTMTAVTVFALLKLVRKITQTQSVPLRELAWTSALMLITSQIKYAFLPMALASFVFLAVILVRGFRAHTLDIHQIVHDWRAAIRVPLTAGAVTILLISGVLFAARYGTNMVKYHNPVPACNAVLTTERCLAYGPFARDAVYRNLNYREQLKAVDKLDYPLGWINQMVRESYFAVGPLELGYPTAAPLPVSYWAGWAAMVVIVVVLASRIKRLWQTTIESRLLITLLFSYLLFLIGNNYGSYLSTGIPVAIHGRYMLALLPFVGYLVYRAAQLFKRRRKWRSYGVTAVVVFAVLTAYGGGIMPFIIRSNDGWYWPAAVSVSRTVRSVFWPLIIR